MIYICFAIIKPPALLPWCVPVGNYSRVIGIALLVGWALVVLYFGVFGQQLDAPSWLAFNYQMVALSGLLLVLQPTPGRSSRTVPN